MLAIKWSNPYLPKGLKCGLDESGYAAPLRRLGEGLEGLDWFASEAKLLDHIVKFPYLMEDWENLFERLKSSGWQAATDASKAETQALSKLEHLLCGSEEDRWRYFYAPSCGVGLTPGLTVFRSCFSLMMHVARFPFALQDDSRFADMVEAAGWERSGRVHWKSLDSGILQTIPEMKKSLWENPSQMEMFGLSCVKETEWFM
jgi:hypothetical protein